MPFNLFDKDRGLATVASKHTIDSSCLAAHKTLEMQKSWVHSDKIPFMDINVFDRFMPGGVFEQGISYITFNCMALHTCSRGSVHVGSADPVASPVIDLQVLDNDVDMGILVEAVKLMRKLAQTDPLKSLIDGENFPGPAVQTDEQIKAFVRQAVGMTYHPIATVGMLPKEDGGCGQQPEGLRN
ncbi:hypothetical protein D9758_006627 [Tetrapyrgos nigripes]|uniref:Glucose-methanol-choline oxidoreductase C-terminal domain-containing protein n=1 Tax=Tetrapyrgos nigripes TaxID=182062 RepID=A0A8H5GJV5_9AGAR|nr:hypothetical protein D9758_006627 [Tetrapyrgos nigripes]